MITAKRLLEIVTDLEFEDLTNRASALAKTSDSESCPLILPLVGEFSSGKTTLLNALTDSKALETATKPTTATIYEIHFGQETVAADVYSRDGTITRVEDLSLLKNETLADADCVNLFDTSTKVPPSTVLVDTPGLSAPDPRHKEALVRFLPMADGVILVADINQQITRSMLDFVKSTELSGRRLFLVLTKADCKAKEELDEARKYAAITSGLKEENIVCASAAEGDVGEFLALLNRIAADKADILSQVNSFRLSELAQEAITRIEQLRKVRESESELEDAIADKKNEIKRLDATLDAIVDGLQDNVQETCRSLSREFEDNVSARLESVVSGASDNYDQAALSAVNTTAELYVNKMRNAIRGSIRKAIDKESGRLNFGLESVENLDLSRFEVSGLNYNLNLNDMGHQYDGAISLGVKVAAVAGAVYAGGAIAAGSLAPTAVKSALVKVAPKIAGKGIDAADTISDVGSIIQTQRLRKELQENAEAAKKGESAKKSNADDSAAERIEQIQNAESMLRNGLNTVDSASQEYGRIMGARRGGLVESVVGRFTDSQLGKPQRRKAIHDYIDGTLAPLFKSELQRTAEMVISEVRDAIQGETRASIDEMSAALAKMLEERRNKKEAFESRMTMLDNLATELATA